MAPTPAMQTVFKFMGKTVSCGIANDLLRQGGTAGGRNPAYYKKYITSGFD